MSEVFRVDAGGISIACRIDGEGSQGPWLVFSNSLVTDLRIWDKQVEMLSKRFRILRYDQRGHGGTEVPEGAVGFPDLAADVVALLDHLEIARCTYIGLSMGAPTGLQLYAGHPERIERLVFNDGQAATAATGARTWQERIEFANANGMEAIADATVERWFSPEFVASGGAEPVRRMISAVSLEGYTACAGALQNYDYSAVLPTISVPTRLIAGARDGAMPTTMRRMAETIHGAEMTEIPNAGHIPGFEQPALFNHALIGFLDRNPV
jgi:3-oxoadipate enol-lactonase